MNIVIFGPPGAGKGTQSSFIVNKYKLHQLSTGELLRNEIKNKTKLGLKISSIMNSGQLVSDTIVSNLIEEFVSKNKFMNRLIFDGFPRNILQAKNLNVILEKYKQKIDLVLKLYFIPDKPSKELSSIFIMAKSFTSSVLITLALKLSTFPLYKNSTSIASAPSIP